MICGTSAGKQSSVDKIKILRIIVYEKKFVKCSSRGFIAERRQFETGTQQTSLEDSGRDSIVKLEAKRDDATQDAQSSS